MIIILPIQWIILCDFIFSEVQIEKLESPAELFQQSPTQSSASRQKQSQQQLSIITSIYRETAAAEKFSSCKLVESCLICPLNGQR